MLERRLERAAERLRGLDELAWTLRPPRRAARRRAGPRPAAAARRAPRRRRPRRSRRRGSRAAAPPRPSRRRSSRRPRRCARRARRSTRARRAAARSRGRSRARPARAEVPLDHGDLREVALGVGDRLAGAVRRAPPRASRSRSGRARSRSRVPARRSTGCGSTSGRARRCAPCGAPSPGRPACGISATGRAGLQHEVRDEALQVGQEEQVGLVARRDRAEVVEAVPERRVERRADERVLGGMPNATASRTIALMWPSSAMCSGSRSSVQNAMRPGPYSASSGSSAWRLRARGRLADQQPHARPAVARGPPRRCTPRGRSGCRPRRRRSGRGRGRPARGRRRAARARASRALRRSPRSRRGSSSSRRARSRGGGAAARRGRRA